MDFSISADDLLLQQSVHDFIEEQANACWKEIDRTDKLPESLIEGVRQLGLFGISIPAEYGGLGLAVAQKTLVHEMLGRGPWARQLHQRARRSGLRRHHPFWVGSAEAAVSAENGDGGMARVVRPHRAGRRF